MNWQGKWQTIALALLLCTGGLVAAASPAGAGSAGHAMRRARQALAVADDTAARRDLERVRKADPAGARGLEATMLLADMDFRRGQHASADLLLAEAASAAGEGFGKATVGIARGWLALARDRPAEARERFRDVARNERLPVAGSVCALGAAWADLLEGTGATPPATLSRLVREASQPGFRYAAGLTVAWLHAARGDHALAVRRLREMRRHLRDTSYEDDAELALGLAQLRGGQPRRAHSTFRRLDRRFGTAATSSPPPLLELADLGGDPADLSAKLAELFAARSDASTPLFRFLGSALDRRAGEDARAAIALAAAALRGRGEDQRG